MAGPSRFQMYVQNLMGRFSKVNDVIQRIKKNPVYRNVTNSVIKTTIVTVKAIKDSAKGLKSGKGATRIGAFLKNDAGRGSQTIHVNFSFTFNFPAGSSSGKVGTQAVSMSIDIPASTSKAELLSMLRDIARQWIDDHYSGSKRSISTSSINVTSIQGL